MYDLSFVVIAIIAVAFLTQLSSAQIPTVCTDANSLTTLTCCPKALHAALNVALHA